MATDFGGKFVAGTTTTETQPTLLVAPKPRVRKPKKLTTASRSLRRLADFLANPEAGGAPGVTGSGAGASGGASGFTAAAASAASAGSALEILPPPQQAHQAQQSLDADGPGAGSSGNALPGNRPTVAANAVARRWLSNLRKKANSHGETPDDTGVDSGVDASEANSADEDYGCPILTDLQGRPEWICAAAQFFRQFRLQRIIKESHGRPLSGMVFNRMDAYVPNLIVTSGGHQVNVYDNEHTGTHLDVVSQYANSTAVMTCCCWVAAVDDALAIAGDHEGVTHVISVAKSREIAAIDHGGVGVGAISALSSAPGVVGVVLSSGQIEFRDVAQPHLAPLVVFPEAGACCLAFSSSGAKMAWGMRSGSLMVQDVPAFDRYSGETVTISVSELPSLTAVLGALDSIVFLNDDRLVVKSQTGRINVIDLSGQILARMDWPQGMYATSSIDVSLDGKFLCVGTDFGRILVFDLVHGLLLAELMHKRVRHPIRACSFNAVSSQVLCVTGNGMICRFEHIPPEVWQEWKQIARTGASPVGTRD
ncbi:hypothetical protein CAOG_03426 [Capsaspora owczarzaki ATCC 30864]|nr:hypothetical protein CAOG_03426 [Capsaspora owczarzaki ATCC 30864]|eukprot:XP_004364265.1 hypothetical protein CAOG_03426 [Capsaspora owczarzaki ATCC 30864]